MTRICIYSAATHEDAHAAFGRALQARKPDEHLTIERQPQDRLGVYVEGARSPRRLELMEAACR